MTFFYVFLWQEKMQIVNFKANNVETDAQRTYKKYNQQTLHISAGMRVGTMYKQAILSRLMHFPPNFQVLYIV